MATLIDSQVRELAQEANANWAEPITYYPFGGGDIGLSINAIVTRSPAGPLLDDPQVIGTEADLRILNDADLGVTEITEGKDFADVVLVLGEPAKRVRVAKLLFSDAGSFVVRVHA